MNSLTDEQVSVFDNSTQAAQNTHIAQRIQNIEQGTEGGAVDSVNGQTGVVVLTTSSISDSLNKRYVTDAGLTVLGNTSGVNTGDQSTISGNAATATALQNARTINGVSFNGTANIITTSAADTLSGTTLAATVVSSSLTSVGTLDSLVVTNPITGSITGNAGTATALQNARTINGVSFDGTANIVTPSAAATLTGTTLAAAVVSSSLTSVGTLTDLTVTNPISGSITGNAATATSATTATTATLASTVTTNANSTGDVTSVGNVTTLTSSPVKAIVKAATTAKILYVSQDVGSDSNDGSFLKPYLTIQAAITAANLIAAYYNQVQIIISPPTSGNGYQENLTLSQQGVTLQSYGTTYRTDLLIKGTLTIDLTGTSGGSNFVAASNIVYCHGLLISGSIIFSGSTFQRLFISDSYVDGVSSASALVMTNTGSSGGTKSTITSRNTDYANNHASLPTILHSAGRLFISGLSNDIGQNTNTNPAIIIDGASATGGSFNASYVNFTGNVRVTDNTANVTLSFYLITSGSAAAIVTPSSPNTGVITIGTGGLSSSATNCITGSGIVVPGGGNYKTSTGGDIISTVTQVVLSKFPEGQHLIGAGATAVTNSLLVIKDGHITSLRTTAPTVAVNANAGVGGTCTLSNASDTAGKINLTTGTATLSGVQATITFNKTYAVAPMVTLTSANGNAATNLVLAGVFVTSTTTTMVINFATAGVISTAFVWTYHVIETQ